MSPLSSVSNTSFFQLSSISISQHLKNSPNLSKPPFSPTSFLTISHLPFAASFLSYVCSAFSLPYLLLLVNTWQSSFQVTHHFTKTANYLLSAKSKRHLQSFPYLTLESRLILVGQSLFPGTLYLLPLPRFIFLFFHQIKGVIFITEPTY